MVPYLFGYYLFIFTLDDVYFFGKRISKSFGNATSECCMGHVTVIVILCLLYFFLS